ncbi:IS110 family transposase [Sinorhizobium medicae]|nr:IS110 family transposase [Sinorhizobium medicae]MDX0421150.1 IS110 family transposase [Sinorhizobium medicae]MDX1035569.1 IS110 family transposase [Sinorhizobium medicae]PND18114.1 IS110 family transposase [Ensifer sp. MMN_5]
MTASYEYHIGVDYHTSYSHLVVQDSSGKTLRSGRVKNDRQSLGGFLERYRQNSHAVVEATRNWMVIYDWLDEICDDVVLAHPLKVKAIADAKIKTDKTDATVLAHLLKADLAPEAWAPNPRSRDLRVALRERMFYVRLRTMTKNRIVTVFDRYPEQTAQLKQLGDLFGKAGRIQLAQVNVSEIDRIQIDHGLAFIGDIDVHIKQSEATIRAMTKANGNVKLLKTIPGIGEFFARLIDAEIDDIARFRNPKKLAAYAGLVPSTYSSGGKIIKQGNKWLRWAFVEAVTPAIVSNAQLRAQYEQLKFRGVNKARVAIARKLLTIAFQILRDQRAYEPRDTRATEGASTISRLS